jgi:DNA-binding response OmpR family regulator
MHSDGAALDLASGQQHGTERDQPRPRPELRIGTTLLVLNGSLDITPIVGALRRRSLRPAIMPKTRDVREVVSSRLPRGVILEAGLPDWLSVLRFLTHRGIPTVLLGTMEQLLIAERHDWVGVHLLLPVDPDEVAEALQLVIGPSSVRELPDSIDLGVIKIDLRTHTIEIENKSMVLPPKEFHILVHLALQPGEPLSSSELISRVWPASSSTTSEDVHCRVWRLRKFIGDNDRAAPLITNRRGFGYVLNVNGLHGD